NVRKTPEPLKHRSRPLGILPPAVRPVIAVHRDQRPRLSCRLEGRRKSVEPTFAIKRQCDPGKIDERALPELIRNPVGIGQLEQFPGGSTVAPVPERPLPIRSRLDQVKTWKATRNGSYEIGTNRLALCRCHNPRTVGIIADRRGIGDSYAGSGKIDCGVECVAAVAEAEALFVASGKLDHALANRDCAATLPGQCHP